ncbi:MAG TPA: hypothetical protein PK992_18160 [Planctomycetaceae bacterium]|nr:hypothetical protein [Planctomycetaceae bacterium]
MTHWTLLSAFFLIASISATVHADDVAAPDGMKLVYQHDFEDESMDRYEPTDSTAWKLGETDGNHFASLIRKDSKFNPPVRSPFNRNLIKDLQLGTFTMDIKVQSTIPDYAHRDLCLFFGYQDDSHLYYVHLGKATDDHANQIFIVNEKPRTKISTKTTAGTPWTDEWHNVRLERNVESGEIRVYFDDMKTPAMTATDKTFGAGRVGFGSFDDTGNFDDIRIYTP